MRLRCSCYSLCTLYLLGASKEEEEAEEEGMHSLRLFTVPLMVKPTLMIRRLTTTRSRNNNPFIVLGIPQDSSVQVAQKKFLKLAMKYHPDVSSPHNENRSKAKKNAQIFIRIRKAFEHIRKEQGRLQSLPPIQEVLT